MAANAFIIIRQHCYRRVLLVVPIIIIGLLWQKKSFKLRPNADPRTRRPAGARAVACFARRPARDVGALLHRVQRLLEHAAGDFARARRQRGPEAHPLVLRAAAPTSVLSPPRRRQRPPLDGRRTERAKTEFNKRIKRNQKRHMKKAAPLYARSGSGS